MKEVQYFKITTVFLIIIASLQAQEIERCKFGEFRTQTGKCMQCMPFCPKCKDLISQCQGCSQGFKLNTTKKQCQPCDIGKMTCSQTVTCQPHYKLIYSQCFPDCLVQNCQKCETIFLKTCITCKNSFQLAEKQTKCVPAVKRVLQNSNEQPLTPVLPVPISITTVETAPNSTLIANQPTTETLTPASTETINLRTSQNLNLPTITNSVDLINNINSQNRLNNTMPSPMGLTQLNQITLTNGITAASTETTTGVTVTANPSPVVLNDGIDANIIGVTPISTTPVFTNENNINGFSTPSSIEFDSSSNLQPVQPVVPIQPVQPVSTNGQFAPSLNTNPIPSGISNIPVLDPNSIQPVNLQDISIQPFTSTVPLVTIPSTSTNNSALNSQSNLSPNSNSIQTTNNSTVINNNATVFPVDPPVSVVNATTSPVLVVPGVLPIQPATTIIRTTNTSSSTVSGVPISSTSTSSVIISPNGTTTIFNGTATVSNGTSTVSNTTVIRSNSSTGNSTTSTTVTTTSTNIISITNSTIGSPTANSTSVPIYNSSASSSSTGNSTTIVTIPTSTVPSAMYLCNISTYYDTSTRTCQPCYAKCATCYQQPDQCLECASGWIKYGWKCIRNQTLLYHFKLQAQKPNNPSSQTPFIQSLSDNMYRAKDFILNNLLPRQYSQKFNNSILTFSNITLNQTERTIILDGFLDKSTNRSMNDVKNDMNNYLKSERYLVSYLIKDYKLAVSKPISNNALNGTTQSAPVYPWYEPNYRQQRGPNLVAIIIPSVIGGLCLLGLLGCLICFCCKKCCFKPKSVPHQTLQHYQNQGAVATPSSDRRFVANQNQKLSQKVQRRVQTQLVNFNAATGSEVAMRNPTKYSDEQPLEYEIQPSQQEQDNKQQARKKYDSDVMDYEQAITKKSRN